MTEYFISPYMQSGKKIDLRNYYRRQRNNLTKETVEIYSEQICQKIISLLPIHQPLSIHLFLAIPQNNEVDLTSLIRYLWEKQHHLYVPRVTNGKLEHVRLLPETPLQISPYGIPEPSRDNSSASNETLQEIDLVLTPLLVIDKKGNRLGYGGGFYDLFFQEYPKAHRIGVGFFPLIEEIQDCYEGDIPLDCYVTPEKIFSFKKRKMVK